MADLHPARLHGQRKPDFTLNWLLKNPGKEGRPEQGRTAASRSGAFRTAATCTAASRTGRASGRAGKGGGF